MKRPNSQYLNVKVCRCSVRWDQTPCELNLTLNNLLKAMEILEPFLKSSSSIILLVVVLLLAYIVCSTSFSRQGEGMEPPGPRALPLLGNMLQLDLKRPYSTLLKVTFYAPVRNRNTTCCFSHLLFSRFPRNMDQCSLCTLDPAKWWFCQDTTQ